MRLSDVASVQYHAERFRPAAAGAETFGAVLNIVTPDEVITRNVHNALKIE